MKRTLRKIYLIVIIALSFFVFSLFCGDYDKNYDLERAHYYLILFSLLGLGSILFNLQILKLYKTSSGDDANTKDISRDNNYVFTILNWSYFLWSILFMIIGILFYIDLLETHRTDEITPFIIVRYLVSINIIILGLLIFYDSVFYGGLVSFKRNKIETNVAKRGPIVKVSIILLLIISFLIFWTIELRPSKEIVWKIHENGITAEIRSYPDKYDSTIYDMKRYYSNGNIEMECRIENGLIKNKIETYYSNGLRKETRITYDSYDSTWILPEKSFSIYDKQGRLRKMFYTRNQDTTAIIEFDSDGKPIDNNSLKSLKDQEIMNMLYKSLDN